MKIQSNPSAKQIDESKPARLVGVRVSEDDLAELDRIADENNASRSAVIRTACKTFISSNVDEQPQAA